MESIDYSKPFGQLYSIYRFNDHNGNKVKSPDQIYAAIQTLMKQMDGSREHLLNVMLNTKNQIIGIEIIAVGTLNACICHPREVFYPAVSNKAASIIIAHNHPSGDPTPSQEDIAVAKKIVEGGNLLGIDVLDSIIIGKDAYYSMKDEGDIL